MSIQSTAAPNAQPPTGMWGTMAPYVIPPMAAGVAIVPVFRDLIAKSAQQLGQPMPVISLAESLKAGQKAAVAIVPVFRDRVARNMQYKGQPMPVISLAESLKAGKKAAGAIVPEFRVKFRDLIAESAKQKGQPAPVMSPLDCVKAGMRAAPTAGAIIGTQMVLQPFVKQTLVERFHVREPFSALASAAVVGMASVPVLAVFNGQTLGWTVGQSLRNLSAKQGFAITMQETLFVAGLSVSDQLAIAMKGWFGDHRAIDYTAAFVAGAAGSLAGHPANTALTRWQAGLAVESIPQLMWGSCRKARAIGCFAVLYKFSKETLSSSAY